MSRLRDDPSAWQSARWYASRVDWQFLPPFLVFLAFLAWFFLRSGGIIG